MPPAVDTSLDSRSDFGLPEMTDGADCSPSTRGRIIVDQGMVPTAKGAQALDRVSPMQLLASWDRSSWCSISDKRSPRIRLRMFVLRRSGGGRGLAPSIV